MPAPEHLTQILAHLGDGGTVAMAERVAALIEETRAAATAATEPDHLAAEAARYRDDAVSAAHLVARMHAAAVGEVRGPIRGGVEDVEDVRTAWLAAAHAGPWRLYRSDGMDQGYRLVLPEVHAYVISDRASNDYQVDDLRTDHPDLIVMPNRDANPAAGDTSPDPGRAEKVLQSIGIYLPEQLHDPTTDGPVLPDIPDTAYPPDAQPIPASDADDDIDWDDHPDQTGDAARAHAAIDADAPSPIGNPAPHMETTDPQVSSADVRAWCIANGIPVAAKGAINAAARAAYDAAHRS